MRRALWPIGPAALVLGAVALATVLNVTAGRYGESWWEWGALGVCALLSAALGLRIALSRQGRRIGWLLLANSVVLAIQVLGAPYADVALRARPGTLPGGQWAVLWDAAAWPLLFAPLAAIAFVFPDGRLPSRRWLPVTVGAGAALVVLMLALLFATDRFDAPYAHVARSLPALPGPAHAALAFVGFLGLPLSLFAAAWALRTRFRRATGIERLQLKWIAYVAGLIPATFAICIGEGLVRGDYEGPLLKVTVIAMLAALPLSVALPVLRYRLYDIDRLINRTVVYGTLTVVLGGVYAVLTLGLAVTAAGSSRWTTAGATLVVAVAFRPLRAWLQDRVDRRFSRARYEGLRQVESFLADFRAGRAAPEDVEGVLAAALGDARLQLRYRLPGVHTYVDGRGQPIIDAPEDDRVRLPVHRAGDELAVIVHDPALDERPDLCSSVVERAGLAIEIARLRVELRRQLDEIHASRARIVVAGDVERRRIERDLHDGAQQRLVSIGLALRHLQHETSPTTNGTSAALDGAVAEIGEAISELRELARGVRPAQLDDGLGPALRDLGGRSGVPVEVHVTEQRFAPGVEAAAYFVACEALTNAIKHARASAVTVCSQAEGTTLVLSVTDDGLGGAARNGSGSGITGIADRVEAHGGTLVLDSPEGKGTVVTAEFPCAS